MSTVTEVKTRLDGSVERWVCELLALEPDRTATLRYTIGGERAVGGTGLVLTAGTVTLAHYWIDRPFNVYHWLAADRTLAYYASVVEPVEIDAERVAYRDLAVDVLIRPSGQLEILDEDELPVDLAAADRKRIAEALEQIVANPKQLIREIEDLSRPFRSRGERSGNTPSEERA